MPDVRMTKTRAMLIIYLALLVFQRITFSQEENCPLLENPDTTNNLIRIAENDYINLTFWLNTSGCKQSNTVYKVSVKFKTDAGFLEDEGRVLIINSTCSVQTVESLSCVAVTGPAHLYRKVNRSHNEIEFKWWWKEKDGFTERNMSVKLNISYPPNVTNLTVDGQEVQDHYVINESQKATIMCSFKDGNPSVAFLLLNENGHNVNAAKNENSLTFSLTCQCEQPWPVVRCEAQGSSKNRSVTFLVRCPPHFTDRAPKEIDLQVDEQVIFNIKGHTSENTSCLLIPESLAVTFNREVPCSTKGDPPDLLLTVKLPKHDTSIRGNWILTVTNQAGTGNTTVIFKQGTATYIYNIMQYVQLLLAMGKTD